MIQKFRKKPIVIEAIWLIDTDNSILDAIEFIGGERDYRQPEYLSYVRKDGGIRFKTLESHNETQIASFGDWIIKGVNGEFYPCKPDIFEKTYELVINVESKPNDFDVAPVKEQVESRDPNISQNVTKCDILESREVYELVSTKEELPEYYKPVPVLVNGLIDSVCWRANDDKPDDIWTIFGTNNCLSEEPTHWLRKTTIQVVGKNDVASQEHPSDSVASHSSWVGNSNEQDDDDYGDLDDDGFQPCDHCDLPDACADFGCAIKNGVRKNPPIDGVF